MVELLKACPVELILWTVMVLLLTVLAGRVIGKIRAETLQHEPNVGELISKFSELHAKGELTEAEFRTIKTDLAAEIQKQSRNKDQHDAP